jgi:hypothetical protein
MFVPVVIPYPYRPAPQAYNAYPREAVVAAALRTLESIRAKRQAAHERQIAEEMKRKRFFLGRNFTRDEAIARLKDSGGGWIDRWSMVEVIHGSQERDAERIALAASKAVGDTFKLTHEEADRLHWEN